LSATLLLAAFIHLAQRYERTFVQALEFFTTYELMPKILISAEAEANTLYVEAVEKSANDIAKAAEVLDKSRTGIEAIVSGLVRATTASEDRIVDFFNFAQSFRESVGQLMGYKDDIHTIYSEIAGVLREIKNNQLTDKMIGEIVDKSVARSMAATQEAAETVREAFREDIRSIGQSQARYLGEIKETRTAIENFSHKSAADLTLAISSAFQESLSIFRSELAKTEKREDISRMIATDVTNSFRKLVDDSCAINKKSEQSIDRLVQVIRDMQGPPKRNISETVAVTAAAGITVTQ
jgi:hypothetical protein